VSPHTSKTTRGYSLQYASICALTLTRVIVSIYYERSNFTKSTGLVILFTGLEPTIGVINACLPFLPQVFKRACQILVFERASAAMKSISIGSSKGCRRATSSSGNRRSDQFARLKYPSGVEMNPIKDPSFASSYVGTASRNSVPESGPWDDDHGGQHRVFVRKDFSIESESYYRCM
jgi:hypothetical protein